MNASQHLLNAMLVPKLTLTIHDISSEIGIYVKSWAQYFGGLALPGKYWKTHTYCFSLKLSNTDVAFSLHHHYPRKMTHTYHHKNWAEILLVGIVWAKSLNRHDKEDKGSHSLKSNFQSCSTLACFFFYIFIKEMCDGRVDVYLLINWRTQMVLPLIKLINDLSNIRWLIESLCVD